jgi:hypothetical protein
MKLLVDNSNTNRCTTFLLLLTLQMQAEMPKNAATLLMGFGFCNYFPNFDKTN